MTGVQGRLPFVGAEGDRPGVGDGVPVGSDGGVPDPPTSSGAFRADPPPPPPPSDEVLRARAYLSRVAEPPAPALAAWVRRVGAVLAAETVRSGQVPEAVDAVTGARRDTDRAEADLARLAEHGGRLLVPESPDWPFEAFRDVGSPAGTGSAAVAPLALWVRGPAPAVDAGLRGVAIVGARAASDYGLWVARDWAACLADRGVRVVSGAALGIDGAAHRGALAAGGTTVAVLASGIDRPYPPSNAGLIEHIAATGLVVTEYPPGVAPGRHRFLVRNRLIAALSRGTLVVEAAARSGAHRTASEAAALGRAVMVVPGPVTSALSLGCHALARDCAGATVVGRVDDVIEDVGRVGDDLAPRPWTPPRPTDGLAPDALRVHEALSHRVAHDAVRLAHDAGVDPRTVTTHLRDLVDVGLAETDESGWRRRPG